MTFLQLVNKVLSKLREDEVAALPAGQDYPDLVALLVNEAKEDIEDLGDWYPLRTTVNKTTVADTATVSLTTETNERSYLLYSKNRPQAFLVEDGTERRLGIMEQGEMDAIRALQPDAATGTPVGVSFAKGNSGLTAHFFPVPDGAYDVRFIMVVPQDDLVNDDDEITIPGGPVWREAVVRAMEERGEEFAGPLDRAQKRAADSLRAAVLNDYGRDELTFEPV